MRHVLMLAGSLVLAAASTVAAAPVTTADELLRLWNQDYDTQTEFALDPNVDALDTTDFTAEGSYDVAPVRSPRGSTSMTPRLDRLLKNTQPGSASGGDTGARLNSKPQQPPKPPKPPDHDDPPTPTPEPASLLLFGAAAATAAGIRARRKNKNNGTPQA